MGTYTLKRITKLYSDGEGSNLGKKLAIGAAAIGSAGAGLWAAKKGHLGANAQHWTGKQLLNNGFKKTGAKTMAEAQWTRFAKNEKSADAAKSMSKEQIEAWKKRKYNKTLDKFNNRADRSLEYDKIKKSRADKK